MTVGELKELLDSCHPQEQVLIDADGHQRNTAAAYRVPGGTYGTLIIGDDDYRPGPLGGFYLYPENMRPGRGDGPCADADSENAACRVCARFRQTMRRD